MSLDQAESGPQADRGRTRDRDAATLLPRQSMGGMDPRGRHGTPGTPKMKRIGRATFGPIQDGRWWFGDFEQDRFLLDGTFALKWQLHWVSGWAPRFGEYRASMADNYGNADVYRGYIEQDRLVFESCPPTP